MLIIGMFKLHFGNCEIALLFHITFIQTQIRELNPEPKWNHFIVVRRALNMLFLKGLSNVHLSSRLLSEIYS